MRPTLKSAWYNMVVVVIIGITLLIQFVTDGSVSLNMSGTVLFIGGIIFLKYSKAKVIKDERDVEIERQATTAGLWAVMILFTAAGVYVTLDLDKSPIEHQSFINFFCAGYVLFFAVVSLITIALFGREKEDSGGFLQSLGEMNGLQIEALMLLPFLLALLSITLYRFPVSGSTSGDLAHGIALQNIPILSFLVFPFFIHTGRAYEYFRPVIHRARQIMLWSALVTALAGLSIITAIYLSQGAGAIYPNLFILTGFCTCSLGTLIYWVCLLFSPAKLEVTRQ